MANTNQSQQNGFTEVADDDGSPFQAAGEATWIDVRNLDGIVKYDHNFGFENFRTVREEKLILCDLFKHKVDPCSVRLRLQFSDGQTLVLREDKAMESYMNDFRTAQELQMVIMT